MSCFNPYPHANPNPHSHHDYYLSRNCAPDRATRISCGGILATCLKNIRPCCTTIWKAIDEETGDAATTAVKFRYAYPLVQYKVLHQTPTLVGLGEGAGLLAQLFLQMREIDIDGQSFPVLSKHIRHEQASVGIADDLIEYRFETLWMALNQTNYRDYRHYSQAEQQAQLKRVLTSQLLALFREFGLWLEPHERIMVRLDVQERTTQFKNQTMVAFTGSFLANVILPDGIGLGKAVSRGFGTVQSVNDRMSV